MTKTAITVLALLAASACAEIQKPDSTFKTTGIITESGDMIVRGETVVKDLPLGSDFYGLWQNSGGQSFYKLRLQSLPLNYGILSTGFIARHVDGTDFPERKDLGGIVRVSGKPTSESFAKLDLRYYPARRELVTKTLGVNDDVFAELLGIYNFETGTMMLNPGIDYRFNRNLSAGVELKVSGPVSSGLEFDYIGPRATITF